MTTRTEYISATVNSKVRMGANTSSLTDVATATMVSGDILDWNLALTTEGKIFRASDDFWGKEQNFAGLITGTFTIWNDLDNRTKWTQLVFDSCGLDEFGQPGQAIKDSPTRFSAEGEDTGDDYWQGNPNYNSANLAAINSAEETFDVSFTLNDPAFGRWA